MRGAADATTTVVDPAPKTQQQTTTKGPNSVNLPWSLGRA